MEEKLRYLFEWIAELTGENDRLKARVSELTKELDEMYG